MITDLHQTIHQCLLPLNVKRGITLHTSQCIYSLKGRKQIVLQTVYNGLSENHLDELVN